MLVVQMIGRAGQGSGTMSCLTFMLRNTPAAAALWMARIALFMHSAGTPSFSSCRAFMVSQFKLASLVFAPINL